MVYDIDTENALKLSLSSLQNALEQEDPFNSSMLIVQHGRAVEYSRLHETELADAKKRIISASMKAHFSLSASKGIKKSPTGDFFMPFF